jgi:hypothetical protein
VLSSARSSSARRPARTRNWSSTSAILITTAAALP